MFQFGRVGEGRRQEGTSARWALGESTYRSWRKGRGFTGMNCDNSVSWAADHNMAVGGGPTDTHDGQAAGCSRGGAAAKRCRPVSSGRQFCPVAWFVARAPGQAGSSAAGQLNFGSRDPISTRLAANRWLPLLTHHRMYLRFVPAATCTCAPKLAGRPGCWLLAAGYLGTYLGT